MRNNLGYALLGVRFRDQKHPLSADARTSTIMIVSSKKNMDRLSSYDLEKGDNMLNDLADNLSYQLSHCSQRRDSLSETWITKRC